MKLQDFSNSVIMSLLLLALGASGCVGVERGSVTGGGWIPSADGVSGHKANFGFTVSHCDLTLPPTGSFNYHDKTSKFSAKGSVKLIGSLVDAGKCANVSCQHDSDCTAAQGGTCDLVSGFLVCEYPNTVQQACKADKDCTVEPDGACQDTSKGYFCYYPSSESGGCFVCELLEKLTPSSEAYGFDINYISTNPQYPGVGQASVCAIDNGQGANAPAKDIFGIMISNGPYDQYSNAGNVQGNLSAQQCP